MGPAVFAAGIRARGNSLNSSDSKMAQNNMKLHVSDIAPSSMVQAPNNSIDVNTFKKETLSNNKTTFEQQATFFKKISHNKKHRSSSEESLFSSETIAMFERSPLNGYFIK